VRDLVMAPQSAIFFTVILNFVIAVIFEAAC